MSHRVLLSLPIILLMDPGGIPSDGIKGSPRRELNLGRGGRGPRFDPSLCFTAWPLIQVHWSCTSCLSAPTHTHPINTQVHMSQPKNQNSAPPAVTRPRARRCIWAELVGIKGGDQCCQTSKGCGRLDGSSQQRRGEGGWMFTGLGDFPCIPVKLVMNKHKAMQSFFFSQQRDSCLFSLSSSYSRDGRVFTVCVQHRQQGGR